ncbi:C3a anaphylatoxin chemotactic receptor-like isoform X2 [Perca fluviatilis]|uniref:C3a anaphylatoxin chemotactic receptor-like isoform X2 n=1 Tax=Perca fluviatilis TaxID=8168 RepID=UPI0019641B54|nr:C3a anaphylatoxin chemotactic receptor-like isoform X2 [Perca fluviatilis]
METDNVTSTEDTPAGGDGVLRKVRMASLVIYCVIVIVGTLGNGLVIYVTGCRMKRTVNSVWFLNLALADFLFTAFLIFTIISSSQDHQWQFGEFMCKFNSFVIIVNMFASVFLLTAISLDRCLSIWVVVWAQNKRTVRKAQLICVCIWMTAMVCSTPYAIFRRLVGEDKTYCTYSITHEQKWILGIFRFVVGFLIPFLVIIVCYAAIAVRAGRLHRTRKQRSRRIIFSIVLAFFICWLPYHIIHFIELKASNNSDYGNIVLIVGPLALSLAFMNSCLNPILYVFLCDEFQKKLRQSICFVLESALAEDHLSFMSSRSLSSHLSRFSRKSDSAAPLERKDTATSLNFTESKVVMTDERDCEH